MKKMITYFLILTTLWCALSQAMELREHAGQYQDLDLEAGINNLNYVVANALKIIFSDKKEFERLKNSVVDEDDQFATLMGKIKAGSPETKHLEIASSCKGCCFSKKSSSETIIFNQKSLFMDHTLYMKKNMDEQTIKLDRYSVWRPWVPFATSAYAVSCVLLTKILQDMSGNE